ncbi:MAG: patatin-like phospholipase family protein [Armatimonadetes bacterium]|nr:patatin-like phospholipase family protein [Armatimonadota bacterium]
MPTAKKTTQANGKLAVVVTGAAGHAAALLGALEALEAAGQKPDLLVGASGGALAASLYAAGGEAGPAREALYGLVSANSWQELADIDFGALRNLASRPHEVSGFVRGEALFGALRGTLLGNKGFQHTAIPLFVVATELNTGDAMVFGNETRDSLGEDAAYTTFARTEADLARVNVATAVRASMGVPGLFAPVSLDYYCLVDGSLRARRALAVAAAQPGVERVLWLHAGLEYADGFSLVCDYAGQSFAAGLLQTLSVAAADAFDPHTADPALAGKTVRFVNLATASVGAGDLTKTQALYESGRRSLTDLMTTADGFLAGEAKTAATALAAVVDEADGPRWQATVGAGGNNTLAVTDRNPTIQREFGYELDEYLKNAGIERLAAREPIGAMPWAKAQAEAKVGLLKLAAFYLVKGCGCVCRATTKGVRHVWLAVGADRLYAKCATATSSAMLNLLGTLGGKKS